MIVLISGSRKGYVYPEFESYFRQNIDLKKVTEIVAGGASGVDTFARQFAKKHGINFTEMQADWDYLGMSAGIKRNQEMLSYVMGKATLKCLDCALLAFRYDYSSGTSHMITIASRAGMKNFIIEKNSFDFN